MTGTLTLLTYPQWYGPNEFSDFEKLHPGLTVKTAVSGTTGRRGSDRPDLDQPGRLRRRPWRACRCPRR